MPYCVATNPLQRCQDCGTSDWTCTREADVLCRNCGLVVESRIMCDMPDASHFDDGEGQDPSRLGQPLHAGAEPGGTGRIGDRHLDRLQRCITPASKGPDTSTFSRAMLSLRLPDAAASHTRAIHATMSQKMQSRGKKATLEAMCTFYACKDLPNSFRTVDQVCNAFDVDPSSFLRLLNDFGAHARGQAWFDPAKHNKATDLLPLILTVLGVYEPKARVQITNKVKTLYEMPVLKGRLGHRDTGGVVGALLWVACGGEQLNVTKKALTEACGVKHTTINVNIEIIRAELKRKATCSKP